MSHFYTLLSDDDQFMTEVEKVEYYPTGGHSEKKSGWIVRILYRDEYGNWEGSELGFLFDRLKSLIELLQETESKLGSLE